MDVSLINMEIMSQPSLIEKLRLQKLANAGSRRRKERGDRVVEQDGRRLRYSGIGKAAYWYGALQLSPSYELARRVRAGEDVASSQLPADFEAVLEVYDDLGDVTIDLDAWVEKYAFRAFGEGGRKPSVVAMGTGRHGDADPFASCSLALQEFQTGSWVEQGERTTLIAAIPLGLPKAQLLKQVSALLDAMPSSERDASPVAPKYKVTATPHIMSSARKYLRCLELRIRNPGLTLWQIGERTKLSSTHKLFLTREQEPTPDEILKARTALKETTSRAIKRGHMIAENAARGIFPSYAKCEYALPVLREELCV